MRDLTVPVLCYLLTRRVMFWFLYHCFLLILEQIYQVASTRGFPKLVCSPGVSGTACDADMSHSARMQFENEEGKQRTEEEICDWKKVASAWSTRTGASSCRRSLSRSRSSYSSS